MKENSKADREEEKKIVIVDKGVSKEDRIVRGPCCFGFVTMPIR